MESTYFDRSKFFDASESAGENLNGEDLVRKLKRGGRLEKNPTTQVVVDEETRKRFDQRIAELAARRI